MKNFLILGILVSLIVSCNKTGPNACNGNTRREVKLMTDDLSSAVDTVPIVTTIEALGALAVPEVKSETKRQDVEKQVYTVTGKVNKLKRYRDGDYHIRLEDDNENYLITEVPNPECVHAVTCEYLDQYNEVIDFIESNDLEGKTVTITGVAFVDIDHHYKRKQADNNIELHPIFKISF